MSQRTTQQPLNYPPFTRRPATSKPAPWNLYPPLQKRPATSRTHQMAARTAKERRRSSEWAATERRGGARKERKKKKMMPASLANRACKYNCPLFILVLSFFFCFFHFWVDKSLKRMTSRKEAFLTWWHKLKEFANKLPEDPLVFKLMLYTLEPSKGQPGAQTQHRKEKKHAWCLRQGPAF